MKVYQENIEGVVAGVAPETLQKCEESFFFRKNPCNPCNPWINFREKNRSPKKNFTLVFLWLTIVSTEETGQREKKFASY